ncbi:MAG: cell division protein FtsX [endosymbiont of Galathealinum brachiosum]|uniref:Cell division protein FtsX n=1 Tax=endosymbiont of Galathealinum brachiosum TaxID=2200906 RepID=A0A370DEZ9_9GAMM|nr:MAG: cell division protein FtsX [endosymbiont of Galathealinum brachiosum]
MVKSDSNQLAKSSPLKAWAVNHARTLIASLGNMTRQPASSFMTIAVIAIALALPAGMFVLLNNASNVSVGWDNSAQISVFLKASVTEKQAKKLMGKLRLYDDVDQVSMINKKQALNEFKKISGFGDAIESLGDNPLPHVLTIQPVVDANRPDKIHHLIKLLNQNKQVELAQLDLQWVKRLFAMLEIAHRAIWVIASLLGIAVLLVVGNTIRLDIQNRREEIEVTKLIGGTDAFIRRPFLYTGLWYGVGGGLLAWILTILSISLLDNSVEHLASLYNSGFQLKGLSFSEGINMIGFSCFLGLFGSWIAVGRHLSEIEPS